MTYQNFFKSINLAKTIGQEYSSTFNSTYINPIISSSRGFSSGRNDNQNSVQPSFNIERKGKLKWKDIINIDLDNSIKNNYFSTFDSLLENLIFSKFDENDIQLVQENSIIKLVRIYQFLLEYLLISQQKLNTENKMIETNFKALMDDATNLENHFKQNKEKLSTIKKQNKEKDKMIKTYNVIMDQQKQAEMNLVINECKICEGKRFINYDALKNHYFRRHPDYDFEINFNSNLEVKKIGLIEKNLETLKDYYDGYLNNVANENYIKLLETQKNLENNLNELKNEKTTLNNLQENLDNMNKKLKKTREKKVKSKKEEEFISTSEKLSKQINDVHAHNNQKILKVSKDLDEFRKSVLTQLELANEGKVSLKATYNYKDFMDYNNFMEKRNSLAKFNLSPQTVENINFLPMKFNASKNIESDYSNFGENEKQKIIIIDTNSLSKIEDKKENSPSNNQSGNKGIIVQILKNIDESDDKPKAITLQPPVNEEAIKLSNRIYKFYQNFVKRDNDIYENKLKHEDYYEIVANDEKIDKSEVIETMIKRIIIENNKNTKINFEDKNKIKYEKLTEFLKFLKDGAGKKSKENSFYKHYFDKIVSLFNLDDYLTENFEKHEKRKEEGLNSKLNKISHDNSGLVNKSLGLHHNQNDEINNVKKEISSKRKSKTLRFFMDEDDEKFESNEVKKPGQVKKKSYDGEDFII